MNLFDKGAKSPTSDMPLNQMPATKTGSPGGESQASEEGSATTNRLNAETNRLLAEANECCARQLREQERIADWLQRSLIAEADRLRQLDQDLRAHQAKAHESDKVHREGLDLKHQAEVQAQDTQRRLAEAQERLEAAEEAERHAEEARRKSEAAIAEAQPELEKLKEARADREKAEAALEETRKLQARLWPAGLRGREWESWRDQLIARAAADTPAAILLARLHLAAALERSGRLLTLELVRDVGRSVYEASADQSEKIAQALTQAAGGQFAIKTVRVGDRVDNKFMKPSAAGVVEVRSVSGWAVRDGKGTWQFPAEVG